MTADQPLVTHDDLRHVATIERIMLRNGGEGIGSDDWAEVTEFVADLRAAAKPALPEGWVLVADNDDGWQRALWHADGRLYFRSDRIGLAAYVENHRDSLTPLVTAASLVPEGWFVEENGDGRPTIWDGQDSDLPLPLFDRGLPSEYAAFDVLAALVSAAQAERGESR